MCGIAGFWTPGGRPDSGGVAAAMGRRLTHRGPDQAGQWSDDAAGIALAHRRLAILDLSAAGHQPMSSADGRYVIVFNGEIYNHQELRAEMARAGLASVWRGHSDTESLLAAIQAWGIDAALKKSNGMFAFALWDRRERKLHFARDRLGEKPLYYGWQGGSLLFGSELKALQTHPAWSGELDRAALALFMRHAYVPAPWSIYRGIFKLPPGTRLEICQSWRHGGLPEPQAYWSAVDAARAGGAQLLTNDAEAADELERLLGRAVQRQMVADVPLGAFLSGGVDSSTIVALMQARSSRPVKTFSIGFAESCYNEAQHAKEVARHLGTDHEEVYVSAEEALAVVPSLPALYDEPFADSSQIPTHLVARMARRHVTVSLSGDGGDELFAGYNHYFRARNIWRWTGGLPAGLRRGGGRLATALTPAAWDRLFGVARPLLPPRLRLAMPGDKVHKLGGLLGADGADELYRRLVSFWPDPQHLVIEGIEAQTWAQAESRRAALAGFTERMMLRDQLGYLADNILAKVDRAAMGVSLETRIPLLDREVVEFSWRVPLSMKIRDGQGKWLLRRILYRHVPRRLIERPKMGFSVPLDAWLRGPLRDWAESLLDETRLRREGYFESVPIRRCWTEHLSGRRNWQHRLWNVLMFEAWLDGEAR